MNRIDLSWTHVEDKAYAIALKIRRIPNVCIYGVPRGGIPAALLVHGQLKSMGHRSSLTDDVNHANVIVDDIIDSGRTRGRYAALTPPFYALVDKEGEGCLGDWVSFPWERMANESSAEDSVTRIIQAIGDDPKREGLIETPSRVVKSWSELFAGYNFDASEIFKTFEHDHSDEMIILKNIDFVSMCEHHMLPFTGKAHVAYIPADGRVVGLSKLARLVHGHARRLQLQERLTQEVTNDLMSHLNPQGAACVIEASHSCMSCRGVRTNGASMVTSSLVGVFRDKSEVRQEFLQLIKG